MLSCGSLALPPSQCLSMYTQTNLQLTWYRSLFWSAGSVLYLKTFFWTFPSSVLNEKDTRTESNSISFLNIIWTSFSWFSFKKSFSSARVEFWSYLSCIKLYHIKHYLMQRFLFFLKQLDIPSIHIQLILIKTHVTYNAVHTVSLSHFITEMILTMFLILKTK